MRKQLEAPIANVLQNYIPVIGEDYKTVFANTVGSYFNDPEAIQQFRRYVSVLGYNADDLSPALLERFVRRLLNRLKDSNAINQNDSAAAAQAIVETIRAELAVDNLAPIDAALLIFSHKMNNIDSDYQAAFAAAENQFLNIAANQISFNHYLITVAKLSNPNVNVLEPLSQEEKTKLETKFFLHVLARLNAKNKVQFRDTDAVAYEEKDITTAMREELGWAESWRQAQLPQHQRLEKTFSIGTYVVEEAILGYSTYGLDDGVTAADRPIKNIAYGDGDPNTDPSKTTGHIKNAFEAHTNLMYAYFGVTVLSFLLVPARLLCVGLRYGWEDCVVNGEKKSGLKSLLTDKNTYVELGINTVIVTLTGIAVFATSFITWPVVIGLFSVGLFAAVYFGVATKNGNKANLENLYKKNQKIIKYKQKIDDQKAELQQRLSTEVTKFDSDPAMLDQITKLTRKLESARAEAHDLYITQQYANTFFGKNGVYIKMGISAATVIAYTLLATAIFSASAVFLPSLIVMSVLGAAALTYFIVKQVRAYQLEKEKRAAHNISDEDINNLVRRSDKKILAELDKANPGPRDGAYLFNNGKAARRARGEQPSPEGSESENVRNSSEEVQPLLNERQSGRRASVSHLDGGLFSVTVPINQPNSNAAKSSCAVM